MDKLPLIVSRPDTAVAQTAGNGCFIGGAMYAVFRKKVCCGFPTAAGLRIIFDLILPANGLISYPGGSFFRKLILSFWIIGSKDWIDFFYQT